MKLCNNMAELKSWAEDKQTNEQKMLQELNDLFKKRFPTEKMRWVVLAAFDAMMAEVREGKTGPARGAIEDEKGLAVWVKTSHVRAPDERPGMAECRGRQDSPRQCRGFAECARQG
jgi:hypothetical protein